MATKRAKYRPAVGGVILSPGPLEAEPGVAARARSQVEVTPATGDSRVERAVTVAWLAVISLASKPVTLSLKVMVTSKLALWVSRSGAPLITTSGEVASTTVRFASEVLPLASVAVTVILPLVCGVAETTE